MVYNIELQPVNHVDQKNCAKADRDNTYYLNQSCQII
jgi:hypothetical protein